MLKHIVCILLFALPGTSAYADNPKVLMQTSLGDMIIALEREKAPQTVANFLQYVDERFYDGTVFHRVIRSFMIQGGGFTSGMKQKDTRAPIANEADNGLKNLRGTLAMARTPAPHSAMSEFFINAANNPHLDHTARTPQGWGYAVFGKVIEGMETLDKITGVKTGNRPPHANVPVQEVIIKSITRIDDTAQPPENRSNQE